MHGKGIPPYIDSNPLLALVQDSKLDAAKKLLDTMHENASAEQLFGILNLAQTGGVNRPETGKVSANLLMLALQANNMPLVGKILDLIEQMTPEQQMTLLKGGFRGPYSVDNALTFALQFCPESVDRIINAIESIPKLNLFVFLKEDNSQPRDSGLTHAWMLAAKHSPAALFFIIERLKKTKNAEFNLSYFLTFPNHGKKDYSQDDVLMTLVKNNSNVTAKILDQMVTTYRFLDSTSSQGIGECGYLLESIYQALRYAAQSQPEAINIILQAMEKLDYRVKKSILSKTDHKGENIPMIAYQNNFNHAQSLLDVVNKLNEKDKNSVLTQINTNEKSLESLISDNEDREYFLNNRTNSSSLLSSHSHFSGSAPQPSSSADDPGDNATPKLFD